LVIDVYQEPKLSKQGINRLFQLAHAAFHQKRKMLRSSLRSVLGSDPEAITGILERVGIDPRRRPETLSLEEWIRLTDAVQGQ